MLNAEDRVNPSTAAARQPLVVDPALAAYDASFFGHPRGLSTLFFTEMWERFSYYGMRALLILFMTAAPAAGGLGFDTATAGAIYGLYTSMVYLMTLPGGWVADRLIGAQRAVLYGGILIAAGHFSMAVPSLAMFYLGLTLIVIGTGLLKGNVSVIVGRLYSADDGRRDAGYSIFYMGINTGAFVAPLVCGYLGQRVDWHAGFAAAGVGMTDRARSVRVWPQVPRQLPASSPPTPGRPPRSARQRSQATVWTGCHRCGDRDVRDRRLHRHHSGHSDAGGRCRRVPAAWPHRRLHRLDVFLTRLDARGTAADCT